MSTRLALALMAVGHLHPQRGGLRPAASAPRLEGARPADVSRTIAALSAQWLQSKRAKT